jgi:hypothetical protein
MLTFVFGIALADLVDRFDPSVPEVFRRRWPTLAGYAALAGIGLFGIVRFAGTVSELV